MKRYQLMDFSGVKRYSITTRDNKVKVGEHFAEPPRAGRSFSEFFDSLPHLLGADNLRGVVDAVVNAREKGRPVVLAMGGHVIKCGLQPVIKALIDADVITAVATNGSVTIHDYEVSLVGATSEDVAAVLASGDFGFSLETGQGMNDIYSSVEWPVSLDSVRPLGRRLSIKSILIRILVSWLPVLIRAYLSLCMLPSAPILSTSILKLMVE